LKVIGRSGSFTVEVAADGKGLSSRAGTALLPLLSEQVGLTRALEEGLVYLRERVVCILRDGCSATWR
jgi:hypothetical protein